MFTNVLLAAGAAPAAQLDHARLITWAVIGIAVLIALITWAKIHPFVALLASGLLIGIGAGYGAANTLASFAGTFGSTMASVGILVGLGAMFGKLLADSGGADSIVDALVARSSPRTLPWSMALVGAIIGLPMFFEVGLVLLIPVILLVARRANLPLMRIAIPTLAGLSAMHGLVPPHPGPLAALANFEGANLGLTLGIGVLVAIPTVIIAGPLFSVLAAKWVPVGLPANAAALIGAADQAEDRPKPGFLASVACVLLPVVLMLANALYQVAAPAAVDSTGEKIPRGLGGQVVEFVGTPTVALALALIVGMVVLGRGGKMKWSKVNDSVASGLPAIAGIVLIVGAGGGLKGVLVDTGLGGVIADFVHGSGIPLTLLAWVVAVIVRVATGSATVSIVTTAGILAPAAAGAGATEIALLVLAIGAGSVFLSHVNDAGFWLVKEYMGVTVGQNFKTWSLLECVLSVVALVFIQIAGIFI
jgi:GntP family gluconate:H+ symporter